MNNEENQVWEGAEREQRVIVAFWNLPIVLIVSDSQVIQSNLKFGFFLKCKCFDFWRFRPAFASVQPDLADAEIMCIF